MAETLTTRLQLIKNDTLELVNINEINAAFDKIDNNLVPAAKMFNSIQQSIPTAASTLIQYNSTSFDSYAGRAEGPMVDLAAESITIRKTGVYMVSIGGSFVANVTGVRRLDINKNGVTQVNSTVMPGFTGSANTLTFSSSFYLVAGDVITGGAFQNSGGALGFDKNTFVEGDFLDVVWVGSIV